MDAARYTVRSYLPGTGAARAQLKTEPPKAGPPQQAIRGNYGEHGWMA